ncbi:hypothetical protein [Methanosphaera sp.]|uniref:hypothetical protein n=1 Tax=Methanosphaera sp. TaxID=2666342 RepID=UPI003D9091BA
MKVRNMFTLNDWKFNEFAAVIILVQVLMWIVGIAANNSIHIPIFNDIITLLYIGFIPGIIILRDLKLHDLGNTFTTLLSVGLSIISVTVNWFIHESGISLVWNSSSNRDYTITGNVHNI